MLKTIALLFIILPISCLAQFNIKGRVLNQSDAKPVTDASVFLNNATIGTTTAADGTFTLKNIKPGKYDLVVSNIAFENYHQTITIIDKDIELPPILVNPKTVNLKEVTVKYHKDPNREKYLDLFKNEFLGNSQFASECKILNPAVLDFSYDDATKTLTASSYDFLQIENDALGYKLKYLITNFSLADKDSIEKKIFYQGAVLMEEMHGKPAEERRWERDREAVYENSPMHFLRAAIKGQLEQDGFRVQRVAVTTNPERPSDSLINAKIDHYRALAPASRQQKDSLAYWEKKSSLPKGPQKLLPAPLSERDIIKPTDKPGQYALTANKGGLFIAYSKTHRFHITDHFQYLYNANNKENTLVLFNQPEALFYANGVISNPYSLMYYGVWGRNRVAELLPIDYGPSGSVIQQNDKTASIISKIDTFEVNHPIEKAYLQFDKPYYVAGDTIYFKAYVTMGAGHRLSTLSGVLHVDLVDGNGRVNQSIKLKLDSGICWGDFTLQDSLQSGNYRIRAWTNLMRNGPAGIFERTVPIGGINGPKQLSENPAKQAAPPGGHPDFQLLPEGGTLVEGIACRIAFKAIGPDGLGADVKGVITDNDGRQVVAFASTHLGMGYFELTPAEGKSYSAKVTYADGQPDVVNLPKAANSGIALSVNDDAINKASVSIAANKTYFEQNKGKDYTLLVYSGGTATVFSRKLDSPVIKLDILKGKLHTGVATITLISPQNGPLCERLLFIQGYDQLDLKLSSDKTNYSPRERVHINLNLKNSTNLAATGHFSVSVIDENKVPGIGHNEDNILTDLLLTSDLTGTIEQPGYYFSDTTSGARHNLDLLMRTQGYRHFTWKKALESSGQRYVYQPEQGINIDGQAQGLFNKPLKNGMVTLISPNQGAVQSATTDDKGNFHFSNLMFNDTAHFVLSAVSNNNSNNTRVTWFDDTKNMPAISPIAWKPVPLKTIATLLENDQKQQQELINNGYLKGKSLKEVVVKTRKIDNDYRTTSLAGPGNADQVMHSAELERVQGPIITSLNGRLHGVTFIKDTAYLVTSILNTIGQNLPKKMLVIVDDVESNSLPALQAADVETVEVLRSANTSIYGMNAAGGVLIITTKRKRGLDAKDIVSSGILPIAVTGFYRAREFYSPKYPVSNTSYHDLRSTIFWKPELKTDKNGNAAFEYYNADGKGGYRIVIEGIDDNGNLGRKVLEYKVE